MQIYDPTVSGPTQDNRRAALLTGFEGKTIAVLENGKLNAVEMLRETAALFAERHNCKILPLLSKANASAPAPAETLQAAADEADFLITGLGD